MQNLRERAKGSKHFPFGGHFIFLITFSHDYYGHYREKIDVDHSKVKGYFHESFAEKYLTSAYKLTVVFRREYDKKKE